MRRHVFYIANHIAKYRAVTTQQLFLACESFCGQTVVYRNLAELKELGLIQRVSHDRLPKYGYLAKPDLDECLNRPDETTNRLSRTIELEHAFAVTDALMELSRYSFVKNVAHECELTLDAAKQFSGDRRPDGIIQIERGQWRYEVAIEVETSRQTDERVRKVFSNYRNVVADNKSLCAGVVFVLHPRCNFELYQKERLNFPEDKQSTVLIVKPNELSQLKTEIFGLRSATYAVDCGIKCQRLRAHSTGAPEYLSINSTNADFQMTHLPA